MQVKEMEVFMEPKYGYGKNAQIDFKFIEHHGQQIMAIVGDIVSSCERQNLFNHEPEQQSLDKIEKFEKEKDGIIERMKKIKKQMGETQTGAGDYQGMYDMAK